MHQWENCFLAHERLAIIDPASGDQPLYNEDKSIVVAVNGERKGGQRGGGRGRELGVQDGSGAVGAIGRGRSIWCFEGRVS